MLPQNIRMQGLFKLGQDLMIQSSLAETLPKTRSGWKKMCFI